MKKIAAAAVALLLAGCASIPQPRMSAPRPQMTVVPHKAPVVKAAPAPSVAAPAAKPTFSERFKKFRGRLKWVH